MSQRLAAAVSSVLDRRLDRRGFLARVAVVGSAFAVAPLSYSLRPGTAAAFVCQCGDPNCGCGSACCDGFTEFCCVIHGSNTCPPGTFMGGWWKADGSTYCVGPRYYIDCNASCGCQSGCSGPGSFCDPGCDGLTCGCGLNSCNQRQAGCITFRYGQCNQQIACSGRIACRVVTCTPPWQIDHTCSTTTFIDDYTAEQNAPCLQAPPPPPPPPPVTYAFAPRLQGGYYLAGDTGGVYNEGGAPWYGSPAAAKANLGYSAVAIATLPAGDGYWVATTDGHVYNYGAAKWYGSPKSQGASFPAGHTVIGIESTPSGGGYWVVTESGNVFNYGDAKWYGSPAAQGRQLDSSNRVVQLISTPNGAGYWVVTTDGNVFNYGDAKWYGSPAAQGRQLGPGAKVTTLVSTPRGDGYWVAIQDGGVFNYGAAQWFGSPAAQGIHSPPISGMELHISSGSVVGYTVVMTPSGGPPPAPKTYSYGH